MAKRGNIFYTDKDFTDLEVQQQFGFPVIMILHDNDSVIKKISAFDENGAKSIYDFSLAASKDFVTQSITTAISTLKDNTLEFPTFADFPQPGEVGNVYIDLAEDKIYIWDSASSTYISQSWNQTIITGIQTQITALQNSKLDKGTYVGTAQDLYDRFEGKIEAGYNGIPKVGNGASGKVLVPSNISEIYGKIGIGLPGEASEKLEVNGNVKAVDFKGKSVKFDLQASITPTPNTLIAKINGSGLIWYNNSSVANEIAFFPSNFITGYGGSLQPSNSAYGWYSLANNTTGTNNSSFGNTSLYTNTIGTGNSAFGSGSLALNQSGNYNSASGNSSLYSNTAGSNNSAFGSNALRNNTTGGYNSAFGVSALQSNTTANSNTSFGFSSLTNNTTGTNNTAFGTYALTSNSTGSNNVGFGRQTLNNLNVGSDNTAVGDLAGTYRDGSNIVNTLSKCVYIGSQSRANANNMTNEIAIGYNSRGQGSNTATIGNENTETFHLLKNGAGIVLSSPDGSKKVKISIDNSGNLITTLI